MNAFADALLDTLDERTLELLDHRRLGPATHRRGWLVRRALVCADLAGLLVAFAAAELFADTFCLRLFLGSCAAAELHTKLHSAPSGSRRAPMPAVSSGS